MMISLVSGARRHKKRASLSAGWNENNLESHMMKMSMSQSVSVWNIAWGRGTPSSIALIIVVSKK